MAQRCPGRGVIDQTGNREDLPTTAQRSRSPAVRCGSGKPGTWRSWKRDEWNVLVDLIQSGRLSKIW